MDNANEMVRATEVLELLQRNLTKYPDYKVYWIELIAAVKDVMRDQINMKEQMDSIVDRALEVYTWLVKDWKDEQLASSSSEDQSD